MKPLLTRDRCPLCFPGRLCALHRKKQRRIEHVLAGLCLWCNDRAAPDRSFCPRHLQIAARNQRACVARKRRAA